VPGIIESTILSDGSKEVPDDTTEVQSLAKPTESTTLALNTGGSIADGTYSYRVSFIDGDGNEGPASNVTSSLNISGGGGAAQIDLNNIPQPSGASEFSQIRIYRNNSDVDSLYREVTTLPAGSTTFSDTLDDASLGDTLDLSGLESGSYGYYVTYYNSVSGEETRPTSRIGPVTADSTTSPRIRLDDIPKPSNDPETGGFDGIRIYRNLANNQNVFHRVGELTPSEVSAFSGDVSFIDSSPDSAISSEPQVNLEGPEISFGLPLVDVVSRDGSSYVNLFEEGVLSFAGSKGGQQMEAKELNITSSTTVQDLISFMEDSFGIVETAEEESFPDGVNFGGTIFESRLQFTSNMGVQNALDVNLSAFQLTKPDQSTSSIPLTFSQVNDVVDGEGASADFRVFDSLGIPLNVRVTTVLEEKTGNGASFRWIATSADNEPESGSDTVVGTGLITTDGEGNIISVSNNNVGIERRQSPSASPLEFELNFDQVSGLSSGENSLSANQQDGFGAGTLSSFIITEGGTIEGIFTNGSSRNLGQIRMARFANNSGLQQVGDNMYTAGVNSGLPIQGEPGTNGIGNITAGAVELSNTDIGQNLIELILASTQYRGGARVITSVQQLLDELLALRR